MLGREDLPNMAHIEKLLVGGGIICTLVGGIAIWSDYSQQKRSAEPEFKYPKNLENKVYLVTGSNTGKFDCYKHGKS